jgi:hypothetical protein
MADQSLDATTVKPLTVPGTANPKAERDLAGFAEAKTLREHWEPLWQECYDYGIPNRSGFYEKKEIGEKLTDNILDSTTVHAVTDFTSRIRGGLLPDGSRWVKFKPGTEFAEEDRPDAETALAEVEQDMFDGLSDSNASSEFDEAVTEMSIGTGVLHVEDGGVEAPFRFTAVPLSEVYFLAGPFGGLDEVYRPLEVRAQDLLIKWPAGKLNDQLTKAVKDEPRKPVKLVEVTVRDWTSKEVRYEHRIIAPEYEKHIVFETEFNGEGSSPWIPFRWSRSAGEVWGRGPLLYTLPDARTVNLTIELILENAEKSIAGMWQSDDETINPATISFVPGTIIAKQPGTSGLEPLQAPGRLDFANMILSDMRDNIRKGLFSEPLGPTSGTPASATEANFRIADLNRRITSPFGRLVNELVKPLTKRLLYIRREAGKIKLPRFNGKMLKIVPVSPLAKAADVEQILSIDRFLEQVGGRFGPELMNAVVDGRLLTSILADLHGVPFEVIRDQAGVEKVVGQAAEAQAMMQGGGQVPQQ